MVSSVIGAMDSFDARSSGERSDESRGSLSGVEYSTQE